MNKKRIAFIIPRLSPYNSAMASTRLRAYDIIRYLKKRDVAAGLFNPLSRYDKAIFQKSFNKKSLELASRLKQKKTEVIFDINVNYIDPDDTFVNETQQKEILAMLCLADAVITPSPYLRDLYAGYNDNTVLIEEIIEERFFLEPKIHTESQQVNLVFCGYSVKSSELYIIKDTLRYLYDRYKIGLILISERDPRLEIIPYRFYRYNHKSLPDLLSLGDIKISPRDMNKKYNLGHSFIRIGYPMSLGIPAVASPVPSYSGSPAVLCDSQQEWRNQLERLIREPDYRRDLGEKSRSFVRENFSEGVVMKKYFELLGLSG